MFENIDNTTRLKAIATIKNYLDKFDWGKNARPEQLPPNGKWKTWLIMAGRGFGKTRIGSETIRMFVDSKKSKNIALIGKTIHETKSIMVEGVSGILSAYPKFEIPKYISNINKIEWPNGAFARIFSGDNFESLRGPQFDTVWIDELAKFRNPDMLFDQVSLSLRLGKSPKCIITTTPKPIPVLSKLIKDSNVYITRGSTFDNAKNLSKSFLDDIKKRYENTQIGSQEIYGELLEELEGALWARDMIKYRATTDEFRQRIVIAIDPAITNNDLSDETGIVVAAKCIDNTFQVIDDLSGKFSPADWGERVVHLYKKYNADKIVAEVNRGGDLVEQIISITDKTIPYKAVRATRGKLTRAEPIAALYEKGYVFHERPLRILETQMCTYNINSHKSPDRLDALVWAITELTQGQKIQHNAFVV